MINIKKIICLIFGHKLEFKPKGNQHSIWYKVTCKRCGFSYNTDREN